MFGIFKGTALVGLGLGMELEPQKKLDLRLFGKIPALS